MRDAAQAVALDPSLARTQTVLGFVQLVRIDIAAARAAFEKAIALDAADPLPHLGLGLATIRTGQLAAGREELEVAASLDPAQSLLRSYLGKAYYEEKRDRLATSQFELAKRADPNDPTPYLYDAIRKRAENRPLEALADFNTSIALNNQRAVYRSSLLLDQDRATRQVDLAALVAELASEREATALASASISDDPSNDAGHRFLAQVYGRRERHEIARSSEQLQAQMLQPLSLAPIAPELAFTGLGMADERLQDGLFNSESSSMFERDRGQGSVQALAGNHGTAGARVTASRLSGPLSLSIGVLDYSTNGFRPNSDVSHKVYDAFAQYAVSPELSLQMELKQRRTREGDVVMAFDPAFFAPKDRFDIDQNGVRLGATYRPGPGSTWLAAVEDNRAVYNNRRFDPASGEPSFLEHFDDHARQYELQYQHSAERFNVIAGGGYSRVGSLTNLDFFESGVFEFPQTRHQRNAYVYSNLRPLSRLSLTLGMSRDFYVDETTRVAQWSPKLGARLQLSDAVTVRAAHFGTIKRALITQQTLEPTQVAGFNQFFDDPPATVATTNAAAVDWRLSRDLSAGAEVGRRDMSLRSGTLGTALNPAPPQRMVDSWWQFDATWIASHQAIVSIGAHGERFTYDSSFNTQAPNLLRQWKLPLTLRAFPAGRVFGEVVVTPVWQHSVHRPDSQWQGGTDGFTLVDASLGWRLPDRRGSVSIDVKNLFDRKFSYQDDDFRSTETRLSRYLPTRRVSLTLALYF
jgi:Tfp pilus assembly protein PilF